MSTIEDNMKKTEKTEKEKTEKNKIDNIEEKLKKTKTMTTTVCPYPKRVQLDPGKLYLYCTCKYSSRQPFCDEEACKREGEMNGKSLEFRAKEVNQKYYYLCQCKKTKSPPYCDGSHAIEDLIIEGDDEKLIIDNE